MNPFLKPVKAAMRLPFFNKFWPASLIVLLAGAGTFVAFSQSAPPNIKALKLSQDPLYTSVTADKPTLTLLVNGDSSITDLLHQNRVYDVTQEYLGYHDAESCYRYNNTPTEVAATDPKYSDYKRFDRIGPAVARKCTGANDGFSGNFLNFATSSFADPIRMALSGGDRVIDTASGLTFLQRAMMPSGSRSDCNFYQVEYKYNKKTNTYDESYQRRAPGKSLPKDNGNYLGAVPLAMRTAAANSLLTGTDRSADIVVGNRWNHVYFGVSRSANSVTDTVGIAEADMPTDHGGTKLATCGENNQYYLAKDAVRPKTAADGTYNPAVKGSGLAGTDNFFYTRVRVCDSDENQVLKDVRDYSFCRQQANGFHKPIGSIQKYSDQMRLAAFSFLVDNNIDIRDKGGYPHRFGGVLRSPMKYVGKKTFDTQGIDNTPDTGNPTSEWDANTGVFKTNPDNATQPNSGVINYINKFGRTGPNLGIYRGLDPIGELYNEALRYLQGFEAPNPLAIVDTAQQPINDTLIDGFPYARTWTDPYGGDRSSNGDYSCLKANIAVIGDVSTWETDRVLDRAANTAANLPDFKAWRDIVTKFEANTDGTYIDGQGVSRSISNHNAPNTLPTKAVANNSHRNETVGQAYWARSQDIRGTAWTAEPSKQRPGLRVRSFFFDVNQGGASTRGAAATDSYRKYENQFFRAAKYGGYEADGNNPLRLPYNKFGNPFKKQDGPGDDVGTDDNNVWQDPANPGEARTFYLPTDPRATLRAFDDIFNTALRTASGGFTKGTVSNTTLSSQGSLIYQGSFDSVNWTGDVQATALTLTGTSTASISATPSWTVATQLAARTAASRNIVIGRTGSTSVPVASTFTWASLDAGMKIHLSKLTPSATADSLGPDRVNYLRGDRLKEGAPFRARTQVLGDIVNSGIVYSGTPTLNITPRTDAYKSFYESNKDRTAAIFVGANDGMLHAFNATNGSELFGYIPSWMGPKLAALTADFYNSNHQAYVDATPAVAEAQVGTDWKTVLVGGTGAGGPGVYALDVTNPAAFDASKVLWEFTKNDDPDMGYVVGNPKIVKVRTSAAGTSPATYRWFAIVASGVNNYLDSSGAQITGSSGNPALFFLALDKPAGTAWTSTGTSPNYYKLSVPAVDTALNAANAPGLINFQPVLGLLKELTQIYMGDLHGKVWKLDFTKLGASSWSFNALSFYKYNEEARPMYIAKTASGAVQPITMAPLIASAAASGKKSIYVAFGTGKFLEASDTRSTAQNSFYALYDDDNASVADGVASISGRGRLMASTVTGAEVTTNSFKWGRPTTDADTSKRSGWYFDFPSTLEKSISGATIIGNQVILGNLVPPTLTNADSCREIGGGGKKYNVNIDAGNGTFADSAVGLLGGILALNIPSALNGTGRDLRTTLDFGSNGARPDATTITPTPPSTPRRLSWRQINNYQDLKNAP
jgi:type IV pilus assembly protein PilY1